MKKINFILFITAFLLAACSAVPPQATVPPQTSEAFDTVPAGGTSEVSPTPTLHPQFISLQETIAASGERFILTPQGFIEDNGVPIPGLTVAPDGTMTLTVNGETVTLDPADVTFDDEGGISIDGYERDKNGEWVEANTPIPAEQLATMSDEQKLDVAPSVDVLQQDGQISADIDPTQIKVQVEAGHVVTYTYNGEHVAAHDLRLDMTVDQMAFAEYGKEMIQRVFFDNNWDFPGYTPSLEEREILKEQILKMVEGSFAVNWGFREGEFTRPQSNGQLKAPGWDLRTVANRNAFFDQVLLPNYRAAAANGTLFADGSVIPLDNGVQITGQLPDVNVVLEYNEKNTIYMTNGNQNLDIQNYPWVNQEYDKESNTLTVRIGVDEKLAKLMQEALVGGPVLGSLRDVALDQLTGQGLGDMSGIFLLDALGVSNLGPNKSNDVNGDLNPDSTVKQGFLGLDPKMYNRE